MYNKTIIIGRLGNDPYRTTRQGKALTQLSVADNNGYYDENNQWVEKTTWYNVTIWKDVESERLVKGALIYIEGRLNPRIYTNREGIQNISMDIKCDNYRILTTPMNEGGQS